MSLVNFIVKGTKFVLRKLLFIIFQYPRHVKFRMLSTCENIKGKPIRYQPVQINGKGIVKFEKNVRLGFNPSPYLYSGYIYIDVRKPHSTITFGENVWINNNCSFMSEGEGIAIGRDTLIGTSCEFVDSDFHDLNPLTRIGGRAKTAKIIIGKNVFIGSNVKVMKGVVIGDDSVVANGSIVTRSIPCNVLAGGVPAKVIRSL